MRYSIAVWFAVAFVAGCAPEQRWVPCCGDDVSVRVLQGRETTPGHYECPCSEIVSCSDTMRTCGYGDAALRSDANAAMSLDAGPHDAYAEDVSDVFTDDVR